MAKVTLYRHHSDQYPRDVRQGRGSYVRKFGRFESPA